MKNREQEQAKELYFQTNMNKTEIAEKVGVARKTILYWSKQHDWDKLRLSARTMPSLVAERRHDVIDQCLNNFLAEGSNTPANPLQLKDAQTLHLLATTIKKLKTRTTINESMEMFGNFIDSLDRRNPTLAQQIKPEIEEYITLRNEVEGNNDLAHDLRKANPSRTSASTTRSATSTKSKPSNSKTTTSNSSAPLAPKLLFAPAPEYCTETPPENNLNEAA